MKTLMIECGVAETRGALLENDEVREFFFAPARGDEHLPRPAEAGDIYLGRVKTTVKPINGAFVDIGEIREAFIPFTEKIERPNEGASVIVRVRRPALGGKGAVLSLDWRKGLSDDEINAVQISSENAETGQRLNASFDSAVEIARRFPDANLVTDSANGANAIKAATPGVSVEIGENLFEQSQAEEALDAALQRIALLPGGGRMIFDQTEGPCIIDVDAGAAAGGGNTSVNDAINKTAAAKFGLELSRRAIGGRVVVDFLPPSSEDARKALYGAAKKITQAFGGRAGSLSKDGLFDMTLQRSKLSLLERATEFAGDSWPVAGRRFTLEWIAKEAIRNLERTLARAPSSRPRLVVSPDLKDYLDDHNSWTARLIEKYSARFSIDADETRERRTYDLAE